MTPVKVSQKKGRKRKGGAVVGKTPPKLQKTSPPKPANDTAEKQLLAKANKSADECQKVIKGAGGTIALFRCSTSECAI
eukprot:4825957-Pyramimonas_sp.AAC.1